MAQPNVAREPSMEEILASIRRIIESNDPITESQMASTASAPAYDDAEDEFDLGDELESPFLSQVPANDPGIPFQGAAELSPLRGSIDPRPMTSPQPAVAAPLQVATPAEPQERTLSLADVAARVRAAAGRVPEPMQARSMPPQTTPVPQPREIGGNPMVRPESMMRVDPVMSDLHVVPPLMEIKATAAAPAVAPAFSATQPEPMVSARENVRIAPAPSTELADQPEKPAAASLPAKIEEAAMLLSHEAGEQVARSFKELVDVFNGMEHQSVEDMARDMLQPMLREWLDDNLPTLVERLVREEIERVARGPRR
jgi:uncharacterized protein